MVSSRPFPSIRSCMGRSVVTCGLIVRRFGTQLRRCRNEAHSDRSANRASCSPLGKMKHKTEAKRGQLSKDPDGKGENVLSSPYVRRTDRCGSNEIIGGTRSSSSVTQSVSSGASLIFPKTVARNLRVKDKYATTFVDSVINLCNKSSASCNVMSEPCPSEDIFVRLYRSASHHTRFPPSY